MAPFPLYSKGMVEKRTYAQRAETIKRAVKKRRKRVRQLAIEHLGGCCQICGYLKCFDALEIHHRDPKEKSFAISAEGLTRSWDRVRKEIEKCILICANCHREVHAGITQLPAEMSE